MTYRAIEGHRRIKALLSGAVGRGSIPPTLLFAGPPGVGKALVAGATAAALNCLTPIRETLSTPGTGETLPFDACGTCRSCDRIHRGMHVDVLRVTPDERASIKIDVIRDALQPTAFRPFEGRRRVIILDEAETLEPSAQNALLKSLEEPPPGTIFILISAVPHALLPTVLSRCMRLRFGRLTEAEVVEVLIREPHNLREDQARAAAALADGSVAQALAIAEADPAGLRETAIALLQQAGRTTSVQLRIQSAAMLTSDPPRKVKERPRAEVGLILRMIASMVRDIELLQAGGDTRALANPALSDQLAALTRAYGGARAREAFSVLERAITALDRPHNAGPKIVAEWLATRI